MFSLILSYIHLNFHSKEVKNAWDEKKSIQANLGEMGLSFDPNVSIGIPKKKQQLQEALGAPDKDWRQEDEPVATKKFVADALEADAKAPRRKMFRLPKSQVINELVAHMQAIILTMLFLFYRLNG